MDIKKALWNDFKTRNLMRGTTGKFDMPDSEALKKFNHTIALPQKVKEMGKSYFETRTDHGLMVLHSVHLTHKDKRKVVDK